MNNLYNNGRLTSQAEPWSFQGLLEQHLNTWQNRCGSSLDTTTDSIVECSPFGWRLTVQMTIHNCPAVLDRLYDCCFRIFGCIFYTVPYHSLAHTFLMFWEILRRKQDENAFRGFHHIWTPRAPIGSCILLAHAWQDDGSCGLPIMM